MSHDLNPYSAPQTAAEVAEFPEVGERKFDRLPWIAWPILLGLNLIVPLLFGWPMTKEHGRLGMALAVGMFLAGGWILCYYQAPIARKILLGTVLTGLSQFVPVLHVLAGIVGLGLAEAFLFATSAAPKDVPWDQIGHESTGFIITFVVGIVIALAAFAAGVVLSLMLPKRWFHPRVTAVE